MAMLAEPRRKQKVINLRAKNNAWSNDSTKFGQRMLEKMGWTSGKGLGASENGITEHVVAKYKNDEKGLGFEDKNDQWTKHEDDFNALLANLSNASDNTENLHSGISLEDKSKKSKARIHYHKFTRGKDISRYSEKDLANIFGKKSFKCTEASQEAPTQDLKASEQIFTEKGSMEDYFKSKLAKFKSKSTFKIDIKEKDSNYDDTGNDYCELFQESVKPSDSFYNQEKKCDENSNAEYIKCKLKSKKRKKHNQECQDISEKGSTNNEISETQNCVKDKMKRKKSKSELKEDLSENTKDTEIIIKKKKSKKNIMIKDSCPGALSGLSGDALDQVVLKQNKKNAKSTEIKEDNFIPTHIIKSKKSKKKCDKNTEDLIQNNPNIEQLPKKKRKRN